MTSESRAEPLLVFYRPLAFSSVPVSLAFRSSITSALPFGHRKEN